MMEMGDTEGSTTCRGGPNAKIEGTTGTNARARFCFIFSAVDWVSDFAAPISGRAYCSSLLTRAPGRVPRLCVHRQRRRPRGGGGGPGGAGRGAAHSAGRRTGAGAGPALAALGLRADRGNGVGSRDPGRSAEVFAQDRGGGNRGGHAPSGERTGDLCAGTAAAVAGARRLRFLGGGLARESARGSGGLRAGPGRAIRGREFGSVGAAGGFEQRPRGR